MKGRILTILLVLGFGAWAAGQTIGAIERFVGARDAAIWAAGR